MLKIICCISLFILSTVLTQAKTIDKTHLPISNSPFEQYKKRLALDEIYIAFVQPSLISPMSYFGHTFLVFKKHGTWEFSKTFSFSAIIPNHISSKDLIINGASGRLTGRFIIGNFHEFKHVYLTKEQRDISLYRLQLAEHEKNQLIYKSFQVYDNDFTYDFFQQNCSTELIRYLSTIRPNLAEKLNQITIKDPSSTLNLLAHEKLIVKNDITHFSKITHAFSQYLELDSSSREQVNRYLTHDSSNANFGELDSDVKATLSTTSSLLFNFLNNAPPLYKELQDQTYSSNNKQIQPLKKNLTHTNPARISLGLKYLDNRVMGSLSFMPSHRERFEERFSYVNETTLKAFYSEINFDNSKIKLEQFDLLELAAYNKSFSKVIIPTWRLYAGYNDNYSADNHSFMSEIGYGLSFGTTDLLISVMPQINIDITHKTFTGQINTLVSYWFGPSNLSYNFIANISGHPGKNNIHELKLNLPIKNNLSVTVTNNIRDSELNVVLNKRFSF
jgi:hypothetical protein